MSPIEYTLNVSDILNSVFFVNYRKERGGDERGNIKIDP